MYMQILGYEFTFGELAGIDVPPPMDALSEPIRHKGSEVGCIVMHGIGGTPANVRLVADKLIEAGYSVDAPLLPGHGKTVRALAASTHEQWLSAVLDAYDRLRAMGCTKIIPVGLSLGGVLCSLVAANRDVYGLVVMAPPIRMKTWLHCSRLLRGIFPYIGYGERVLQIQDIDLPYAQMYRCFCAAALQNLQILIRRLRKELKNITCPVFAVWAGQDDKVHDSSPRIFRNGLKNAESLTEHHIPHAIHGCTYGVSSRDEVAAVVADYIAKLVKA